MDFERDQEETRPLAAVGRAAETYVHAAALYVAMLRGGFFDEAQEFAEWYLDTFDTNLED